MDQPEPSERRTHYRLRYPIAERPTARIEDRDYEVSEISERGVKIRLESVSGLAVEQRFAGVLRFEDGETLGIEGVVLRSDGKESVLKLAQGISQKRIVAEQIRLRQKYPLHF